MWATIIHSMQFNIKHKSNFNTNPGWLNSYQLLLTNFCLPTSA